MNHIYRRVNGRWITGTQLNREKLILMFYHLSDDKAMLTPIQLMKKMRQSKIKMMLRKQFGLCNSYTFMNQFRIMDLGKKGWISCQDFVERAVIAFR